MSNEMTEEGDYSQAMERMGALRRESSNGREFWLARDLQEALGYATWREFEGVIDRARNAFLTNGVDPSHQIVPTHKLMEVGKGAQKTGTDYFLSRAACYLIAMNGDPSKREIAGAQAYFAIQTRKSEMREAQTDDEKRLEMREKVKTSFKRVSAVAKDAGVEGSMQGVFHDARFKGLYGMSLKEVRVKKNLPKGSIFDFAAPLELSMHDFQMNLAADVIKRDKVSGHKQAIATNENVAKRVRKAVLGSGGTSPENLPLVEPIKEVAKRLTAQKKIAGPTKTKG